MIRLTKQSKNPYKAYKPHFGFGNSETVSAVINGLKLGDRIRLDSSHFWIKIFYLWFPGQAILMENIRRYFKFIIYNIN